MKKHGTIFSIAIIFTCILTIVLYILKIFSLKALLSLITALSIISLIAMFGEIISKKNKTIPIPRDDGTSSGDNID